MEVMVRVGKLFSFSGFIYKVKRVNSLKMLNGL